MQFHKTKRNNFYLSKSPAYIWGVISSSRISALAISDYYGKMARVSKDKSYWFGFGALALGRGYSEPVDPNDLYALCALGKSAATVFEQGRDVKFVIDEIEAHQAGLERPRRAGYDLTVGAPKSMSSAFLGHPDETVRDAWGLVHRLAVQEMLKFGQDMAGYTRIIKDGEVTVVPAKMVFGVFTHYTNRNNEPHLHSHVIVPNVVRAEDGKWRALDARELYEWHLVLGAVYRAGLRKHSRRLMNVEWTVRDGWKSDITPLLEWKASDGSSLLETYSTRTQEVNEEEARLQDLNLGKPLSSKARAKLAVRTRKAKDFGGGDARIDEIAADFRQQLKDVFKLGEDEWREMMQLRPEPLDDNPVDGLWLEIPKHLAAYGAIPSVQNADELVNYMARVLFDEGGGPRKEGALSGRAYISVQDIYKSVYDLFGGFVSEEAIEESLSKLLSGGGSDQKLRLIPLAPAVYVKGETAPLSKVPIRFYATAGVMNSEALVLELAGRKTQAAILDDEVVNKYLAETIETQRESGGFVLSEEQQHALRHLFTSDTSATLLMGAQGAGKTTMFSHFSRLAEANSITVWGLAPTGTAAQKLGDTLRKVNSEAQSMTIESFVGQVLTGSLKVPKNLCVILDESSQVDTLELAETLDIVTKRGAKLILVGDDRQLGSVRYGGMFATLFAKLGGARLTETRRAADAWDRTAQSHLRMGDLKEAIRVYEQAGRISVVDDQLALVESVRGWLDGQFVSQADSFVITNTKREEVMANQLAKAAWGTHRHAWVQNYLDTQVRHYRMPAAVAESRMQKLTEHDPAVELWSTTSRIDVKMGDLVAIRQSLKVDKNTWLKNGQRARVVDITDKSVMLFIQDDSSARHVRVPIALLAQKPDALSYGWASTVYRTQSMELGTAQGAVAIADIMSSMTPDTPVEVRRTTRRSKSFQAEFLENKASKDGKEAKVSVRLANGKVRTVAASRVFLSSETKDRIENLIVEARDGNALVLGTEGMNLDALLVSASRARQRTDFLFRSVKATESDYMSEKLLADADPEELVRATMALYVARQSQPEQPDSAYLRLAREREAVSLAATVDLDLLGALRLWLADNLTSGVLDVSVDEQTARTARDRAKDRLSMLEEQMAQTDDLDRKAHIIGEVEACQFQIDYAQRELARLEVFSDFIGHAEGALSDKAGRVVIDERYIKDRISLVDEAIAMAEDKDSWTEIEEAIEVPLPENTAREVVDVSSKEQVKLDRKAKLFSCVSYCVASDWMVLADALYDKALADNLSSEEVLASVDLDDSDRLRLREAFSAVAVNRIHPTAVSHPVTLRALREEALENEVDPDLLATVERITESLSDQEGRRAEQRSQDRGFETFEDQEDEYFVEHGFEPDLADQGFWVPGEDEPLLDDSGQFDSDDDEHRSVVPPKTNAEPVVAPEHQTTHEDAPKASEAESAAQERRYSGGFFYRDSNGIWRADMDRREALYRKAENIHPNMPTESGPFAVHKRREIRPGSGDWYDPVLDENNESYTPELTKGLRERQFDTEGREYQGGFFYRDSKGVWCVDFAKREEMELLVLEYRRDCLRTGEWDYEDDETMAKELDISRRRRISFSDGDPIDLRQAIYDPSRDEYAMALKAAQERWSAEVEADAERRTRLDTRRAYGSEERVNDYGASERGGYGKGRS